MQKKPLSVYVHIPFCVRKCLYCDFLSAAASEETKKRYVEKLLEEMTKETADGGLDGFYVDTVFFGGGTPSLLEVKQIEDILCKLKECVPFGENVEISMEMNPATVDLKQLQGLYEAGVNRVSIGVQTLQDAELVKLGRVHLTKDFYRAWEDVAKAGFRNRNVDLMTGIPGQTLESLSDTIRRVAELGPEHISAYSLIIEEGTPFAGMYPEGAVDEDTDRAMYELTGNMLAEAGYHRYEISNYAKENFACRHNMAYWTRQDYIGFGIGAASLIRNTRFRNSTDLSGYLNGQHTHEEVEKLSVPEQMAETMFLGLRLLQGVSEENFRKLYGKRMDEVYPEAIYRHSAEGLLERKNGYLRLTKRGLDLSNYVMADFLPDEK